MCHECNQCDVQYNRYNLNLAREGKRSITAAAFEE